MLNKRLSPDERQCMVWDIERGTADRIEPLPWQTDTCIGEWHYKPGVHYKSPANVIQRLVDVVSKNGNLLLNIPVRGNGTIDDREVAVLNGIAAWMDVNKECIFGTRPWKVFGEGPTAQGPQLDSFGMNEGKAKPFSAADIRYTLKGGVLYAIVLGAPHADFQLKSLGAAANLLGSPIQNVAMLGSAQPLHWTQSPGALTITPPQTGLSYIATVFKISAR
jgi:alpha-L-fucosidase